MIHIITGSTLGGTEYVGDHIFEQLSDAGIEAMVHNQPNIDEIPASGTWLVVTSTHGAGDYPDNIVPFIQAIQSTPPRMSEVKFAVIAIGDSSYDTFCAAGKHADNLLADIGGARVCDCLFIDVINTPVPEDEVDIWLSKHQSLLS
ncbi:FMN-binding protein MioC [Vibrio sp. ZSDE26]|uniref:FMN-binding protein MioC n=1 Tax=Vibrio amylolyticus TaxID=2847292 RepID=A0A9X1XNC1_9VIBR|nr:FMN-binding protein MioC [Vibrio amylolyticus]MCK6265605.1 FMN-binding protein MioC [Vibrio amylolyticus]